MSIIDDGMKFLEDLILGDFNEQQMVSAQVVAGLISLIPVVDQVMDARDVSGCLYRINKHGGLGKASLEQKIDLGFAAFGVVPSVGSAFKTVFKPLYKQRKAAKGVINGGVAMIERMLGHKKGGAVRWLRALDWAGETQAAIIQANLALDSCIAMLHYLGQSHWWCPDHLEGLARDVTPSLEAMRGKLAEPIREASAEIRKFLEEMLGEHAAAVAMAVATSVPLGRRGSPATPHGPSLRAPTPHAPTHGPALRAPSPQIHVPIGETPRTKAKKGQGSLVNEVQKQSYEVYKGLDFAAKGLLGEHIVEYHVIEQKNWGLVWNRHDMFGPDRNAQRAGWQDDRIRKLNDDGIPTYLCTPATKVFANGIDSFWRTNRNRPQQYAVVEAKATFNPNTPLYQMLGDASASPTSGSNGGAGGRGRKNRTKARTNTSQRNTSADAQSRDMQMNRDWIMTHITKRFPSLRHDVLSNYSRHVFLVTPMQSAAHAKALACILDDGFANNPEKAQVHAPKHNVHDVQKEFGEQDLDEANDKYKTEGKYKRPSKSGKKGKGKKP